ncbi:hypothetical protein ACCT09_11425, partial [Rhizobium ruizarguesonis]
MIGLVLVTHGKLAEEFRHAVEHVVGPQKFIETVCIGPEVLFVTRVSRLRNRFGEIRALAVSRSR